MQQILRSEARTSHPQTIAKTGDGPINSSSFSSRTLSGLLACIATLRGRYGTERSILSGAVQCKSFLGPCVTLLVKSVAPVFFDGHEPSIVVDECHRLKFTA